MQVRSHLRLAVVGAALVVASALPHTALAIEQDAQPTVYARLWVMHPEGIEWTRESGTIPLDDCIAMGVRVLRYYARPGLYNPAQTECRHLPRKTEALSGPVSADQQDR
jgi:hypothetical protein